MLRFLILCALTPLSFGREISLKVDPKVPSYKLIPDDIQVPSKTTWKLKSNEGSKLIFSCRTEGRDCSFVNVLLEADDSVWNVCWDWADERVATRGNSASLTITSKGTPYAVYCNVSSTKSYMNVEEISLETDEEGIEIETKTTCPCGRANKDSGRIVGGVETKENEYPFAVLVGVKGAKRPDCGGSIVTPYHVLTAAHCTHGRSNFEVTVGEHQISDSSKQAQVIEVKTLYQHESYEPDTLRYDISLLYLSQKIEFGKFVGPVCMPNVNRTLVGDHIKVMGWGKNQYKYKTASDVLMKVNLRVIDLDICRKIYPDGTVSNKYTQLCTYHATKDSCSVSIIEWPSWLKYVTSDRGDSGGPVVWLNKETNMYTQYGVVSYGNSCNTTDPAVNTNVYYFMDWIESKIKDSQPFEMCY